MLKLLTIFLLFYNISFAYANKTKIKRIITEKELSCVEKTFSLYKKKEIQEAFSIASFCSNPAIYKMLFWLTLKEKKEIDYNYAFEFFATNAHFPQFTTLQKNFEEYLEDAGDENLAYYLSNNQPQTKNGYKLLIEIKNQQPLEKEAYKEIKKQYFLSNQFPIREFKLFKSNNPEVFTQEIIKEKINLLLWERQTSAAKKLIPYISAEYQSLYKTRISFIKNSFLAFRNYNKLSPEFQNDEGLIYEIVKYYNRKDNEGKSTQYLLRVKNSKYPEKWRPLRLLNARFLKKSKKYDLAYKIVANHNSKEGVDFAESEWFAGWVALRFLNKPRLAINHFSNLYHNVSYSISKSRAAYWLARSYAADKQTKNAKIWYKKAGNYSATFYGQMAILEIQDNVRIKLPKKSMFDKFELTGIVEQNELLKIAIYFAHIQKNHLSLIFLKTFIENNQEDDHKIKAAISIAKYINDIKLISKTSRFASRFNVVTLANYPLITNLPTGHIKQNSLIMSIVKQESGFDTNAKSSVGALGFMQLMPATAKDVAKRMRVPYSKRRLRSDPAYNIKLGTYYINYLLRQFDNSLILAIASYNAGPTNTKRWIRENRDPRTFKNNHDLIDWIEQITFGETRNYVQRILENTIIYAHLVGS